MTKSEKDEKLRKDITEKLFRDTVLHLGAVPDRRIVKTVTALLSSDERKNADCLAAVVAGDKLIVVCDHPGPIEEVLLIDEKNPKKVYRMDLTLKRKKKAAKA